MSKKQKRSLYRILVSLGLLILCMVCFTVSALVCSHF